MLKFHNRFVGGILSGEKTITVRDTSRVFKREIHGAFTPDSKLPFAWIQIKNVSLTRLGNVYYKDAGFAHIDDYIAFLQKVYDRVFTEESKVYVIEFELMPLKWEIKT